MIFLAVSGPGSVSAYSFKQEYLLTAAEKSKLAFFLDLTDDYLKDGYAVDREDYFFEDDPSSDASSDTFHGGAPQEENSLPLAYIIDEDDSPDISADNPDGDSGEFSLEKINAEITACKACGLGASRTNAVPGEGVSRPLVMVIGEGPGAEEDAAGRPFVGKAGKLLDRMLSSIGLSRETNCYIANTVKCRPPGNRNPEPNEAGACYPFLMRQILLLKPEIILCAGRVAAQNLLKTNEGINALRGSFTGFTPGLVPGFMPTGPATDNGEGTEIPVLCTFHPSALLRDESLRRPAWEDLKLLRNKLESLKE